MRIYAMRLPACSLRVCCVHACITCACMSIKCFHLHTRKDEYMLSPIGSIMYRVNCTCEKTYIYCLRP